MQHANYVSLKIDHEMQTFIHQEDHSLTFVRLVVNRKHKHVMKDYKFKVMVQCCL